VPRRSGITGPPRSYLSSGTWPTGRTKGPPEASYAAEVARRLAAAIGNRSVRAVARDAGLDHTTVRAVLEGERWADLVTIARLEQALGTRLWPEDRNA
jgi:hypothetical protein